MVRKGQWGSYHQAKRARAFIARHPWCEACGTAVDLTVDHIRPRVYGDVNENDQSWWRVLCRTCNAIKGTSDLTLAQIREIRMQRDRQRAVTRRPNVITFRKGTP